MRRGRRGARAGRSGIVALIAGLSLTACTTSTLQPVTPMPVDAGRAAALISSYRAERGLGRVGVDSRLTLAAGSYARVMGEQDRVNHRLGGSLPKRVAATGYDWGAVAENLAAGQPSLDATMRDWKSSAGHRANLLNPLVTEIGIAAVATSPGSGHRTYWALILATPRPERVAAGPFGLEIVQ